MGARVCSLRDNSHSVAVDFEHIVATRHVYLTISQYGGCLSMTKQRVAIHLTLDGKYCLEPINTLIDGDMGTIICDKYGIIDAINEYLDDFDTSYIFTLSCLSLSDFQITLPFTQDQLDKFCSLV